MKNFRELIRFITLSGYSDADYIKAMALRHHEKWASRYAKWSYESTKQKLLSAYWTRVVPLHLFTIFCIVLTCVFFFLFRQQNVTEILVIFSIAAVIVYFSLRLWVYNPLYMDEFVPLLNNAIETLSGKHPTNTSNVI